MGKERVDKHRQWPGPGIQLQPLCRTWCHITSPKHFRSPRSWSGCVGADYGSSKTEIINSTILLCAASSSGYWHGPSSELSPWERVWITAHQGQKKNCRITQSCQPQPGLQILIRFLFSCFFCFFSLPLESSVWVWWLFCFFLNQNSARSSKTTGACFRALPQVCCDWYKNTCSRRWHSGISLPWLRLPDANHSVHTNH